MVAVLDMSERCGLFGAVSFCRSSLCAEPIVLSEASLYVLYLRLSFFCSVPNWC